VPPPGVRSSQPTFCVIKKPSKGGKNLLSSISLTRVGRAALLAALSTVRSWSQAPATSPAPQSGALPPKCEQVAQRPANSPRYRRDSSDEDWSFLCDPVERQDPWDAIKYIALGPESWYLSLGGELREQYEVYRNEFWGLAPETPNGYNLSRVMGHADVHFGKRFRAFAELTSSLEFGRKGSPRPFDKNKLDVGQAFFEFNPWVPKNSESTPLSIKIGRQELNYGDGTLIATRDLNVRLPFDGIKLALRRQNWRIDAFAMRPVVLGPNFFNGAPDHSQTFWGVWATHTKTNGFFRQLDLYYLGLDRKETEFQQGTGRDRRNTVGVQVHEQARTFAFVQEGDWQFGSFASGRILAWKFAGAISKSVPGVRFRPTLSFKGAVSSGTHHPANGDLQTFYPLFPNGLYYGYMALTNGSANAIVAHPAINLHLSEKVSLDVETFAFWRQTINDGLYGQGGMFLFPGQISSARYIGSTQDVSAVWRPDRHITVLAIAAYYEAGKYLRETLSPAKNIAYVSVLASYTF